MTQRHYRCELEACSVQGFVLIVLSQGCWIRVFGAMETCSKTCLKRSGAQESHPHDDNVIAETDEILVH